MKTLKTGLILAAITFFIIACTQNQTNNSNAVNSTPVASSAVVTDSNENATSATTPEDQMASARKIYSEYCINCHKEDGSGGVKDIDGVKIKAPNFKSERMRKDTDKHWIEVIENGEISDGMPAFKGKISDADIKNLVKLIRQDFQGGKDN